MKNFSLRISASLLLVFFMLGFTNDADAAFAGKKKQVTTESVAKTNNETIVEAITTATAPLAADDTEMLLLIVLCFVLPPLAVYLKYNEAGKPFIVNLILTLLCGLPGVIHALIHVLKK